MKTIQKFILRILTGSIIIFWCFYLLISNYLPSHSFVHQRRYMKWVKDITNSTGELTHINLYPYFINFERDARQLWVNDEKCSRHDVKFGRRLPYAYLVSSPRSGNTWIRYLIEAATGVFTGSVYGSRSLLKLGYFGEREDPIRRSVIIVKTHLKDLQDVGGPPVFNSTVPIVLLIRNPENTAKSMWNYENTNGSFFETVSTSNMSKDFERIAYTSLKHWLHLNAKCLIYCKKLLIVFYEELLKNPATEVKRIVEFLGFNPNIKRLKCIRNHVQGPAKRKNQQEIPIPKSLERRYKLGVASLINLIWKRRMKVPREYINFAGDQLKYVNVTMTSMIANGILD